MKNIAAILALLLLPAFALGQTGAYSGHSFVGGTPATTSGMNSSNYLEGIIPGASITVYLTGTTTKATIYADGNNTPLSNPFFSNLSPGTNPGGFIFWSAKNQGVDIQAQGGMGNASCTTSPLCYPTATTLQVDVYPNGSILPGCLGANLVANGCTGAIAAAPALSELNGNPAAGTYATLCTGTACSPTPLTNTASIEYPALNITGDSISVGYGIVGSSGVALPPGLLDTPTQPQGYAQLLFAAYGNAGQNIAMAGDWTQDQTSKVANLLWPAQNSGNNAFIDQLGTNDAIICGTTTTCQNQYTANQYFIGASQGIPQSAKVYATSSLCTASGFSSDTTYFTAGAMKATTGGSTLTCTLITYGNSVYVAYMVNTAWSGSVTVTVDGVACSGSPLLASNASTTTNTGTWGFQAARCTNVAAGTHTLYFDATTGTSEILWMASAPTSYASPAPPVVYLGGIPPSQGTNNATSTATYNSLSDTVATTMQMDGLPVTWVNLRNCGPGGIYSIDNNISFNGGTVGNTVWGASQFNPVHPGPYGMSQMAQCYAYYMNPLLRNAQVTDLWAGAYGRITSALSSSGSQGTSGLSTVPTQTLLTLSANGYKPTIGINFANPGYATFGLRCLGLNAGEGYANEYGSCGFFDYTHQIYPWVAANDTTVCLLANPYNMATCQGAGLRIFQAAYDYSNSGTSEWTGSTFSVANSSTTGNASISWGAGGANVMSLLSFGSAAGTGYNNTSGVYDAGTGKWAVCWDATDNLYGYTSVANCNIGAYLSAGWSILSNGSAIFSQLNIGGNNVLPSTLTGYHGNSSGVKVPLALNWTNTAGAVLCDDGNGNLTITGCSVPTGANPSATATGTAINGSATTFMRSDAAPAIQTGSGSQKGLIASADWTTFNNKAATGACTAGQYTTTTTTSGVTCAQVQGSQIGGTVNASQVNSAAVPASAAALASNSSSQIIASPSTYGCLDGYDHQPCTVYKSAVINETSVVAPSTVYTTTVSGTYRVCGVLYQTSASSTAALLYQQVIPSLASTPSTYTTFYVGAASIGTLLSVTPVIGLCDSFILTASSAIQVGDLLTSGTLTGGAWSRNFAIELIAH